MNEDKQEKRRNDFVVHHLFSYIAHSSQPFLYSTWVAQTLLFDFVAGPLPI